MSPDLLGYAAGALVLAAFGMRDMRALRLTAIASNLAFAAYGAWAGIEPVLVLHALLLPLNLLRLAQAAPSSEGGRTRPAAPVDRVLTAADRSHPAAGRVQPDMQGNRS